MIIFKHNQHQVDEARELAKELGFWEFVEVHTNRRINMDKEYEYKGKKYILENQDISPEWNKAIEKNKNYNEGTDIECKAVKENQFYVDYMNRVWACYYIPNMKKLVTESEWYSEYFSKKDSLLNKTLPADDFKFPAIKLNKVVFPDPLGPMIPVIVPSLTFKEQSETAASPPKYFDKLLISKMFSDINYLFNLL